MTQRTSTRQFHIGIDVPVTQEHHKLRQLAIKLRRLAPDDPDIKELSDNLEKIAFGADAGDVFVTQTLKGTGKQKESAHLRRSFAVTWVLTAMASSEDGGLGLSRNDALIAAEEHFGFDFDTLSRYVTKFGKALVNSDFTFSPIAIRPRRKQPAD